MRTFVSAEWSCAAVKSHSALGIINPSVQGCLLLEAFPQYEFNLGGPVLPDRDKKMEPAALMVEVCAVFRSRLNSGFYDNLRETLDRPWPALEVGALKGCVKHAAPESEDDGEPSASQRLCLDDLLKHYRKSGPCATFLASVCDLPLQDGSRARLCYVIPKFRLEYAESKHEEMSAALHLALARTPSDVRQACAAPTTGHWRVFILTRSLFSGFQVFPDFPRDNRLPHVDRQSSLVGGKVDIECVLATPSGHLHLPYYPGSRLQAVIACSDTSNFGTGTALCTFGRTTQWWMLTNTLWRALATQSTLSLSRACFALRLA